MSPSSFLQRPIRWLKAISDSQATTSGGPNFAYDLCARKITPEQKATLDLSCWDLAFNGAEPIRLETLDRFAAAFEECGFRREAFYPCYGLAEATLIVSGGRKAAGPVVRNIQDRAESTCATGAETVRDRQLVGCGQDLPGQRIAIVDPELRILCEPGEIGEIWVAGPSIAQGYWNRPEETEQTLHAYLRDTGEGPFLRTGDLGLMRGDELFVAGRLKDMIVVDGRNHYPQDIEQTVEHSHPAIVSHSCAVFSVDVAGEERIVVAAEIDRQYRILSNYVRGGSDAAPERKPPLMKEAVVSAIRRAVAEHHDLRISNVSLLRFGSLPKTSSGKIQRHACRSRFLDGTLEAVTGS